MRRSWPPGDCRAKKQTNKQNTLGVRRTIITLLPTFVIEWEAKFLIQFSENKVVFFFSKFGDPSVDPRLRTAVLKVFTASCLDTVVGLVV